MNLKTITRKEAANRLQRTTRSIDNMVRDGRLVSTLLNGERRITVVSINAVLTTELHTALTGVNRRRGWRAGRKRGPRRQQQDIIPNLTPATADGLHA